MSTIFTWFGHATLGLETDGYKIVVDPYFTGNPAASTTADQVAADFILFSHGHFDHVEDVISIARRTGATVITNFELANWLGKQGITAHAQHLGEVTNIRLATSSLPWPCTAPDYPTAPMAAIPAASCSSPTMARKFISPAIPACLATCA